MDAFESSELESYYNDITWIGDGNRTDVSKNAAATNAAVDGVECVGNITVRLKHPLLARMYALDTSKYSNLEKGTIALTGFKLESTFISTDQLLDNSKIVPLLNGDTVTLVNSNKSGTITIGCTRTAAGINGGDMISIFDAIRTQGDSWGGTLEIAWTFAGVPRSLEFQSVTVKRCPPALFAGNDLPDMNVQLNYARYHDNDYPVDSAA